MIAPTGSGKGRDFLIPNLLTYPGPIIALDPKGELSAVCARARRALGQKVHVLDPFGVTGRPSDRLNPFDQFVLPKTMLEPDSEMLASLLGEGHGSTREPFWPDTANSLIAGLVAYIAACKAPKDRNMQTLRDLLLGDQTDYRLAKLLDEEGKKMPPYAYKAIAAFLEHPDTGTRPSVLSTARTFLTAISSDQVAQCMADSTISLADVMQGCASEHLHHRAARKADQPSLPAPCLGRGATHHHHEKETHPEAKDALRSRRGCAARHVRSARVRDDPASGIRPAIGDGVARPGPDQVGYPADWATIVNNSAALLSFGFGHYHAAKEYAEVMGLEPGQLASLKPEEAVLAIRGDGTRKISRANYLREPQFDGMFDPNPYFAEEPEMNVEPANPMPPVPATWQEKITHSRTVLMKFLEEAPRKERMVKWSRWSARSCTWRTPSRKSAGRCRPGIDKKRPNRRKKDDRGV